MDGGVPASPIGKLAQHGGRLGMARAVCPDAPQPWIDLSTGINPHAYPAPAASAPDRARLPDPLRLLELEQVAARAFGVEDPRCVVATPGTELALRLLPIVLGTPHATIATPTYSSHADAWRRAGATVIEIPRQHLDKGSLRQSVVVIVNPNNPDGIVWAHDRLLAMHDALQVADGWLVIDEAFVDVEPTRSVSALAGTSRAPNLIVLRSFGKFYGLAGVRLGFAIGARRATERLRGLLGDWPVSADALWAGLAAYTDNEWAYRTRTKLIHDSQRLDELLVEHGWSIVGGTSLFRLARHPDAYRKFEHLLRAGILTRPFAHDTCSLRFGLPADEAAWHRLAEALHPRIDRWRGVKL